jgi:hypothetical protein
MSKLPLVFIALLFFLKGSAGYQHRGRDLRPVASFLRAPDFSSVFVEVAEEKSDASEGATALETGGTGSAAASGSSGPEEVDSSVLSEEEKQCDAKQANCTRDGSKWNEEEVSRIKQAFVEAEKKCKTGSKDKKVVDGCLKIAELARKKDLASQEHSWALKKRDCNTGCQPLCKKKCWFGVFFCPAKQRGFDCDGKKIQPAATGDEEPGEEAQPAVPSGPSGPAPPNPNESGASGYSAGEEFGDEASGASGASGGAQ